jgi:hypothetical protein
MVLLRFKNVSEFIDLTAKMESRDEALPTAKVHTYCGLL